VQLLSRDKNKTVCWLVEVLILTTQQKVLATEGPACEKCNIYMLISSKFPHQPGIVPVEEQTASLHLNQGVQKKAKIHFWKNIHHKQHHNSLNQLSFD
jgi:hypothetical protein